MRPGVDGSGVIGFTQLRAGVISVHPGSFGSPECALWVIGFIRCSWFHSGASWVHWVHPRSFSSLGWALGVVVFIGGRQVHLGAPWVSLCSSGVTLVRLVGRWVHPG